MAYFVGASAAAAHRRREAAEAEEEETMTSYDQEPAGEEWEYKIVRASSPVFARPDVFQQLVREEARAGWTLVEKFDNTRVRFRRPTHERRRDATRATEIDPYRTQFDGNNAFTLALVSTVVIVVMFLLFILLIRF
jgi:hypothetical protein